MDHKGDVHGNYPQLVAWIILNVVPAHLIIPAMLATIFMKKIRRHPVFVSFLSVWIIAGVSSSILVYAGQATGPEPSHSLCLFQASLLFGYPSMTSLAALGVVIQVFFAIKDASNKASAEPRGRALHRDAVLIIAPYASLVVFSVATAILGAQNPQSVSRNRRFFYCSVEHDTFTNILALFAAGVLVVTIVVEVWAVCLLYPRWALLKGEALLDLSMIARVLVFGLYITLCLSLSIISVFSPTSPAPDLAIATASGIVVLIFGTSKDLLDVWCFWRRMDLRKKKPKISAQVVPGKFVNLNNSSKGGGLSGVRVAGSDSSTVKLAEVIDIVRTHKEI